MPREFVTFENFLNKFRLWKKYHGQRLEIVIKIIEIIKLK